MAITAQRPKRMIHGLRLLLAGWVLYSGAGYAAGLLDLADIISHPDQYDRQEVVVSGQVTNVQLATNRQGQQAYGFLLKDQSGTVKVIGLGQVEVKEGDQVIVEGIFSRLRQAGRTIIYNEIKALSIKSLNRLNPDLVG